MPFEGLRGRTTKAAYWPCVGRDHTGQPVLDANPTDLSVRWDDAVRTVLGPDGTPIAIDATVIVDRDIPMGSAFWKGSLQDLPGSAQEPDRDVFEATTFNNVPDFRGRFAYREVGLIRKRDTL